MASGKKTFTHLKDKKVRIIGYSTERDSKGKKIYIYTDLFDPVWANYRSLSGANISNLFPQTGSMQQVVFTLNWRAGIAPSMYVLFRNKAYQITYIDDLEGYKKELKLYCETSSGVDVGVLEEILTAVYGANEGAKQNIAK